MKFLLKTLKFCSIAVISGYIVFLAMPFLLNGTVEKNEGAIKDIIKQSTGLESEINGIKVVTTPKLTVGLGVKNFKLATPEGEPVFDADNFRVKMSLLPLLAKKIRIDTLQADNADITLKVEQDGSFAIEKYFPKTEEPVAQEAANEENQPVRGLPFGLKLADKLPDIHIGGVKITVTDGTDNYVINEGQTDITDFIINKHVKILTSGNVFLKDREQFKYDIKVFNKIMPEQSLHDMVFNPVAEDKTADNAEEVKVNILEILKGIYDYNVRANADMDIKTSKDGIDGNLTVSEISIINLPESNVVLNFKGNKTDIETNIYTAENEKTTVNGNITTGDKPYADLNVKSDTEIANLVKIIKDVALIFNIKDIQTLSANGKLKFDFNVKSDLKSVKSNGYIKVPSAKVYYGLYDIGIDNINADISLDNNNINIKNAGFTVFSQPLKLYGTVTEDAVCDIHLLADKLDLKGLLTALGQAALLKENEINSGTINADVVVKGKIESIKPTVKLGINNLNIKNIPADITLKAPLTTVDILSDGKTFEGSAKSSDIAVLNPALNINIPQINANIKEQFIEILQTSLTADKIKLNISGKISDYLTEKIGLDFVSTGDIKSKLKGDINVAKQTLNLNYATTELSTIIIPMFDKSKMSFTGNLDIKGAMANPKLNGEILLPEISIPEIPVKTADTKIKLNGEILNGTVTAGVFESGGIKAENASADLMLKGNDFYLNNLKGNAFSGKFKGDVKYNLVTMNTNVKFAGSGMNAETAIEGAAGIKRALTGTLGFDTNLTMNAADFELMMKTLKGNLTFEVKNGTYGTIGNFGGFLNADNILTDTLLKNTAKSLASGLAGIKSTGTFETIEGSLSFDNGWAKFNPIKSAGEGLCYYVTGKYNLINGTVNAEILGRLDGKTVSKLGALGELSAEKLLSNIPVFGETTAKLFAAMTADPAGENTAAIPALTTGSKNYKDFKVVFNGGIDSQNSVKSFKWLSKGEIAPSDSKSLKDTLKDLETSVDTDIKENVKNATEAAEAKKKELEDAAAEAKKEYTAKKEEIQKNADDLKNLFKDAKKQFNDTKNALKNSSTTTLETTATETKSETKPATPSPEVKSEVKSSAPAVSAEQQAAKSEQPQTSSKPEDVPSEPASEE